MKGRTRLVEGFKLKFSFCFESLISSDETFDAAVLELGFLELSF